MNTSVVDETAVAKLFNLLLKARKRFKPSDLERIEEAFLIASGRSERRYPLNPWQRPGFYFPGLTARPWHDAADFEAVSLLEAAYGRIKKELLNLLDERKGFQPYPEPYLLSAGTWNAFYIKSGNKSFDDNWAACPETIKTIDALPGLGEMALFSALNPGAHIMPHCGHWNLRLTIHLGMIIPDGCRFRVGPETRYWEEGKCLVFDDSFEHEAENNSFRTRICLLVDVWHPELTPIEIEVLDEASHLLSEQSQKGPIIEAQKHELAGKKWWA